VTLDVREITSPGSGAVSIVSVRGGGALEHVRALFGRAQLAVGRPQLARLALAGAELDEALVCALDEGEVEIHLHGSPLLVRTLLAALGAAPTAVPEACEARAHALVPEAASEAGARILLDQAAGAWRRFVRELTTARDPLGLVAEVDTGSRAARHALRAPLVVLAGEVNAGKSTLFNVLVGNERAITSPEPGTTRDLVRAHGRLGRYVVEFVDSAGERELAGASAGDEIERAGIERARAVRQRADVVLWLAAPHDASRAPSGALTLHTQSDRITNPPTPAVSAVRDPQHARAVVARLIGDALRVPEDPWAAGAPRAFDDPSRATLSQFTSLTSAAEVRAHAALVLTRASF
jgi:hypothetical protein